MKEDVWDCDCEDANEFRGAFERVVEGMDDVNEFAGLVGKFRVDVEEASEFAGFVGKVRVVADDAVDMNDESGFGKPWRVDAGLEANEL